MAATSEVKPEVAEAIVDAVVELPVCEVCGLIGKQPMRHGMRHFCMGSGDASHTRAEMVPYIFSGARKAKPDEEDDDGGK